MFPIVFRYCSNNLLDLRRMEQPSMSEVAEKIGGADRDRTGGLLVANEALSQLSYSPTSLETPGEHNSSSDKAIDKTYPCTQQASGNQS